jgi:glycosyltransferase involved in cell wall biosynthesis
MDSMLKGALGVNYELIIWDNGSTQWWHEKLAEYNPTVLVKSPNIGIGNAQIQVSNIARGKILCITDDDVLFHPKWFQKQLEVLQTFPSVGVVSGSPQRTAFRGGISSNLEWGKKKNTLKSGRMIPDEWERDFCLSVNKHPETHAKATATEIDYILEYKGVKAWAHGHHMQFLGYTNIVREHIVARRSDIYIDSGYPLNFSINQAGLLNLTTYDRTAVHIGNVIDSSIKRVIKEWHVSDLLNP